MPMVVLALNKRRRTLLVGCPKCLWTYGLVGRREAEAAYCWHRLLCTQQSTPPTGTGGVL